MGGNDRKDLIRTMEWHKDREKMANKTVAWKHLARRGEQNIAMLIILIASIILLIIALAGLAGYINSTKEQQTSVSKSALSLAKSGFVVKDITGFSTDSNKSNIEGFIISVSPDAGSDPIDLQKSTLYIVVGNRTARLHIVNGSTKNNKTGGFYTE